MFPIVSHLALPKTIKYDNYTFAIVSVAILVHLVFVFGIARKFASGNVVLGRGSEPMLSSVVSGFGHWLRARWRGYGRSALSGLRVLSAGHVGDRAPRVSGDGVRIPHAGPPHR